MIGIKDICVCVLFPLVVVARHIHTCIEFGGGGVYLCECVNVWHFTLVFMVKGDQLSIKTKHGKYTCLCLYQPLIYCIFVVECLLSLLVQKTSNNINDNKPTDLCLVITLNVHLLSTQESLVLQDPHSSIGHHMVDAVFKPISLLQSVPVIV